MDLDEMFSRYSKVGEVRISIKDEECVVEGIPKIIYSPMILTYEYKMKTFNGMVKSEYIFNRMDNDSINEILFRLDKALEISVILDRYENNNDIIREYLANRFNNVDAYGEYAKAREDNITVKNNIDKWKEDNKSIIGSFNKELWCNDTNNYNIDFK